MSGHSNDPTGSKPGGWSPPAHFDDVPREAPGATRVAGSGSFGETSPAPEAPLHHRVSVDAIKTLLVGSLGVMRTIRLATTSPAFHLALPESSLTTALRAFGSALNAELPPDATLSGHATIVELNDPHKAANLELTPGHYFFLAIALVGAQPGDSGSFVRVTQDQGDHAMLSQFLRSLGGGLRLDRQRPGALTLALYLPARG